jgi:glutathione S-transferase
VEGEDVMKLYYYPSFISLVPHILLEEVEAEYRLVFVNLHGNAHKQPNFLAINPNGLVPVLVDGDLVIYESAAMCLHLADKYPEKELSPAQGSMQRAHFYKWLMWFAATLQPALSMYLHPDKWGSDSSTLIELRLRAESKFQTFSTFLIVPWKPTAARGCWEIPSRLSTFTPSRFVDGRAQCRAQA